MYTRQWKGFGCRHALNIKAVLSQSLICMEENQDLDTTDPGTQQRILIKGTCQRFYDCPCKILTVYSFTPCLWYWLAGVCSTPSPSPPLLYRTILQTASTCSSVVFTCKRSSSWPCCDCLPLELLEGWGSSQSLTDYPTAPFHMLGNAALKACGFRRG